MKQLAALLALPLLLAACQRETTPASGCIDTGKIRKDAICTLEYAPVCGCDGKTYSNSCQATNAGVTRFRPGACAGP